MQDTTEISVGENQTRERESKKKNRNREGKRERKQEQREKEKFGKKARNEQMPLYKRKTAMYPSFIYFYANENFKKKRQKWYRERRTPIKYVDIVRNLHLLESRWFKWILSRMLTISPNSNEITLGIIKKDGPTCAVSHREK